MPRCCQVMRAALQCCSPWQTMIQMLTAFTGSHAACPSDSTPTITGQWWCPAAASPLGMRRQVLLLLWWEGRAARSGPACCFLFNAIVAAVQATFLNWHQEPGCMLGIKLASGIVQETSPMTVWCVAPAGNAFSATSAVVPAAASVGE